GSITDPTPRRTGGVSHRIGDHWPREGANYQEVLRDCSDAVATAIPNPVAAHGRVFDRHRGIYAAAPIDGIREDLRTERGVGAAAGKHIGERERAVHEVEERLGAANR